MQALLTSLALSALLAAAHPGVRAAGVAMPPGAVAETSEAQADHGHIGRPSVKLDRLVVPPDFPPALERHLKYALRRAARHADWGAGRGAHIEFRFVVRAFSITREPGVVHVKCKALGKLPGGMHATSHLNFGGDPHKEMALAKRVLEVVARGVVSRLADLERSRRRG